MQKQISAVFMLALCFVTAVNAAESDITNAKITKVELFGNQFTVYLDKMHSSTGCGHNASVATDSSQNPGKVQTAALLTAWTTGKSVSGRVTDTSCNGDRPTWVFFNVF